MYWFKCYFMFFYPCKKEEVRTDCEQAPTVMAQYVFIHTPLLALLLISIDTNPLKILVTMYVGETIQMFSFLAIARKDMI